ncbi:MAG TPA: FAD-binding oxidoreductase [Solirubrobacteraceae bacterium]|nr:FAD-binding oxidoreductase [Solirubrobacteraceae bacterium]
MTVLPLAGAPPAADGAAEPLAPRMRWWGWGVDRDAAPLPPGAEALLRAAIDWTPRATPAVALRDVVLPRPALAAAVRMELEAIVGAGHVRDDRLMRVAHAVGRSLTDLLRIRAGDGSTAPDAAVFPAGHDEVAAVLSVCARAGVAVVPFGGGTSVVGGVETVREGFAGAIALDLARLDSVDIDERSLLATLGAGLTGPQAEAALSSRGLTLGHFPQSFEFATVGGFVATRSAGQASTGYGRIDALVRGLRMATPAGELAVAPVPASAAGPSLRELLVGSEGTLGVITQATLRVHRAPAATRTEAWAFPSFDAGCDAFRTLEQAGAAGTIMRLSDEDESRVAFGMAGDRWGRAYLRLRGQRRPCLDIVAHEGAAREVRLRSLRALRTLRGAGAVYLGTRGGEAWRRGRFAGPYLRDALLDRGVLVETLETATTWSGLADLRAAVRAALHEVLREARTPPVVACHVSHVYPTGASLYFTVVARQDPGRALEQWRAAKRAASEAIVAHSATITHHHAVGRDHAPWLHHETGALGLEALRALKATVDPAGIMNPGKLLPAA